MRDLIKERVHSSFLIVLNKHGQLIFILSPNNNILYDDIFQRFVVVVCLHFADLHHHIQSFSNFCEDGVLIIQMLDRSQCDEELTAIGVGAGVGHTYNSGPVVMVHPLINFICELSAPQRLTTVADAGRVSALNHKLLDNPMEDSVVVIALLCQSDKVLARLGRESPVESDPDCAYFSIHVDVYISVSWSFFFTINQHKYREHITESRLNFIQIHFVFNER